VTQNKENKEVNITLTIATKQRKIFTGFYTEGNPDTSELKDKRNFKNLQF